ncbi:MAG: hypothetical protein QGD93_12145, partial [Actinomycetota bacterium]|nr:hypothetical protein [Actinomycetota bacterium]
MAIDSAAKRRAAAGGPLLWFGPIPDGAIDTAEDRSLAAGIYHIPPLTGVPLIGGFAVGVGYGGGV